MRDFGSYFVPRYSSFEKLLVHDKEVCYLHLFNMSVLLCPIKSKKKLNRDNNTQYDNLFLWYFVQCLSDKSDWSICSLGEKTYVCALLGVRSKLTLDTAVLKVELRGPEPIRGARVTGPRNNS